jgi:hypothetical protein
MLTVAVGLYCFAALGTFAMAIVYGVAPVPTAYHREILKMDGSDKGANALRIISALCRVLGGAFAALAFMLVWLALVPISADVFSAKLAALVAGLAVAIPSLIIPLQIEKDTGIRTPWRIAGILLLVILVAFVLSVL